ncbi:MAG: hypothetical protein ABIJ84_04015 [bacterium]
MYSKNNKRLNSLFFKIAIFCVIFIGVIAVAGYASASDYDHPCDNDNPDCFYVECDCDSDCGWSGFIGDSFCQDGDVYRTYKTNTCLNPWTESAECVYSESPKLWYSCESWQTCSAGFCIDINVECDSNSACGTNGFVGETFCQSGNVYQNYKTYTCNNPGVPNASCNSSTTAQLKQTCGQNQTCQSGSCTTQYSAITVQTNSATNISSNQATLNGYVYNNNTNCSSDVWFEYGPTTSYGYQATHQTRENTGSFSKNVNLFGNYTNYHFRAIARDCQGSTVYGQDLSFYISSGQGVLSVNKTVRNLTSGSGWSNTVYANPSDTLMFMITLQAPTNQSVSNAFVRDYLPNNLIYKDQLVVSGASYSGDINSGISLTNTIQANQTVTITYQAQLAGAQNFSYGTTTLKNNVFVTSSVSGNSPTSNASIIVTRSTVFGATTIPTGLTNNFWLDSFLLPLAIALLGIWMWRSGFFFGIEKWLDNKKKARRGYKSEKELGKRISMIQKSEN